MKKLFIHHPLFRLLSPLFSGTLVYLLILLINNNIGQLEEAFLGQELYVCIGLAYLIQEYARLSLLGFARLKKPSSFPMKLLLHLISSIALCIGLVSLAMFLYFTEVLGYTPNGRELFIFNIIFVVVTMIYLILYLSHQFLYKINTERLAMETANKQEVEADFLKFKRGINPDLLFESLESLLVLMKKRPDAAEAQSDYFSSVYRYILSKKNRELVPIGEELNVLNEFLGLFAYLPYRKIQLKGTGPNKVWVVPGSVLAIVERIIRTTIASEDQKLLLELGEDADSIKIKYRPEERLLQGFRMEDLADVARNYEFYSDRPLKILEEAPYRTIEIPKLNWNESSHIGG